MAKLPGLRACRTAVPAVCLFLLVSLAAAESLPYTQLPGSDEIWVKLTQTGGRRRLNLVLARFTARPELPADSAGLLDSVQRVLEADLRFSLQFTFQAPDSGRYFDHPSGPPEPDLKAWSGTGAEVLVTGHLGGEQPQPALEVRLYDLEFGRRIAGKAYKFQGNLRWLAHEIADDIVQLLTGEPGISRTRIAFSRQAGAQEKVLAAIDYDGAGIARLSTSGPTALFPDWSPDGVHIAYCTYSSRSLDIHSLNLATGADRTVSSRIGLNTTPAWSPDGSRVCASLSHQGSSDLYLMDPDGSNITRLVGSGAIEVSPCWSPTGRQLAFVSDRTGVPQVYVVNADGTDLRRLTFEGKYNTSPAWSPRGDLIAFVQRQPGGANQICVTNILGDTYVRLTTRGNNEDPCWSPDGLHLAFISNRAGCYELYTMDWNGGSQQPVTRTGGAFSPTWSPVLR